jgi:hypothetical protein
MVRLKHHIVVEAVGRPWVDAFVAGVYDAFVHLRFDGGRLVDVADGPVELFLVEGRHAAPDARYRLTYPVDPAESPGERRTLEVVVTAMELTAKTSLAISSEEGGERLAMKLVLRSVARPDAALVVGTMQWPGRPRSFRRVSWSVQIDVERWWKRVGRHGGRHGGAPVVAKITHSLAGATITVVPRSDRKGRWTVDVVAAVHGRSWARPLAFVALPFVRGSLHTEYRRVLDEVAEDVNRAAAAFAHEDPDQLARDCFTPGALAHRFHSVQPPDTSDQWPGHHVT